MTGSTQRAVVFAYHSVGVRALSVLLGMGVEVSLVLSHEDDPRENQWFDSVTDLCDGAGIRCITPKNPNEPDWIEVVRSCAPDWIFSFYYRRMLSAELLGIPSRGAFNLHGSLLPRYRGRVPVNWAVLHGERETGMSLHRMVRKPDAGALVAQERVSILPNDTAYAVFQKLVCAGETLLLRALPLMLDGKHTETPLDLAAGSYFGGRCPEDGRINWDQSAWDVHNLIRAVAPPYPGAFTDINGKRLMVLGSWYGNESARGPFPRLYWEGDRCYADLADGRRTRLTRLASGARDLSRDSFAALFGVEEIGFARSADPPDPW
ncbi:MAG: formyltransferase [Chromatiaceae bacterium]|nr:formyltransferase [Chromatiaceae bacterium]